MGIINHDNQPNIYDIPRHLRPTLVFRGEVTNPVRKVGVLPFLRTNGKIYVLLQCKTSNGLFEAFAGSVDYNDTTTIKAAAREAHEESNGVLDFDSMVKELDENFCNYHKPGKFCLFFLEIAPIHPSVFGELEIHDGIPRTCHWVRLDTVRNYHLHPGLKHSQWDTTLEELVG